MGLTKKLDGYRRRALYEWNQARQRAAARKGESTFQSWLAELSARPPDVLVGANFAAYGGVRKHIQAIQRYSSLSVALAPLDQRKQAGINNRDRIESQFSFSKMTDQVLRAVLENRTH